MPSMPTGEVAWYCGNCGDGPNSVLLSDHCPQCRFPRDTYARYDQLWRRSASIPPQRVDTSGRNPQSAVQPEYSGSAQGIIPVEPPQSADQDERFSSSQDVIVESRPRPTDQDEQSVSSQDLPPSPASATSSIELSKQDVTSTYTYLTEQEQHLTSSFKGTVNSRSELTNKTSLVESYLFHPENPWSHDVIVYAVPGQSSFRLSTLETASTPLRQPHEPARRAQIAYVRNNGGACEQCKRRKKACSHRLAELQARIDGENESPAREEPNGITNEVFTRGDRSITDREQEVSYDVSGSQEGASTARHLALPQQQRRTTGRARARRGSRVSETPPNASRQRNQARSTRSFADRNAQVGGSDALRFSQPIDPSTGQIGQCGEQGIGIRTGSGRSVYTDHSSPPFAQQSLRYFGAAGGSLSTDMHPSAPPNQVSSSNALTNQYPIQERPEMFTGTQAGMATLQSLPVQAYNPQQQDPSFGFNVGDPRMTQEYSGAPVESSRHPYDNSAFDAGSASNTQGCTRDVALQEQYSNMSLTDQLAEEIEHASLSQLGDLIRTDSQFADPYMPPTTGQYRRPAPSNGGQFGEYGAGGSFSSGSGGYPMIRTPQSRNTASMYSGSNPAPPSDDNVEFMNDMDEGWRNDVF